MSNETRFVVTNVDPGPSTEQPLVAPVMNFDPDQPRDENGQWSSGGGGGGGTKDDTRRRSGMDDYREQMKELGHFVGGSGGSSSAFDDRKTFETKVKEDREKAAGLLKKAEEAEKAGRHNEAFNLRGEAKELQASAKSLAGDIRRAVRRRK